MAFCPGCGYEYREGVTRCPDCDMDLVADLDDVDGVKTRRVRGGKTVRVYSSTQPMVEMLADMLDQEGIPSIVSPAQTSPPAEAMAPSASPFAELHVLEQHAGTHGDLIRELIAEVAGEEPQTQPA